MVGRATVPGPRRTRSPGLAARLPVAVVLACTAALSVASLAALSLLVASPRAGAAQLLSGQSSSAGDGNGQVWVVVGVPGGPGCPVTECPGGTWTGPSGGGESAGTPSTPSPFQCTWMQAPSSVPPPPGQAGGSWYLQQCAATDSKGAFETTAVWVVPAAQSPPPPSPAVLGAQAASQIGLPSPAIRTDPVAVDGVPGTVVNLPTWLWIAGSTWHPYSATAAAGGVSATATAVPVSVTWSTGTGHEVTCAGPGAAYDPDLPASDQRTGCSYAWHQSSVGEPGGVFQLSATVSWAVAWSGSGGSGGSLPSLDTTSTVPISVQQVESVNTDR